MPGSGTGIPSTGSVASIINDANRPTWKKEARIRLIGENNAEKLPDDTIEAFVDRAERVIKKRIPEWATVLASSGEDREFLIDAAISQLCGALAPSLRNIIPYSESNGEANAIGSYSFKKALDFNKLQKECYNEVESLLASITTYTPVVKTIAGVISREPPTFEDF